LQDERNKQKNFITCVYFLHIPLFKRFDLSWSVPKIARAVFLAE